MGAWATPTDPCPYCQAYFPLPSPAGPNHAQQLLGNSGFSQCVPSALPQWAPGCVTPSQPNKWARNGLQLQPMHIWECVHGSGVQSSCPILLLCPVGAAVVQAVICSPFVSVWAPPQGSETCPCPQAQVLEVINELPKAAGSEPRPLLIGKKPPHPCCPLGPLWGPGAGIQDLNLGPSHLNSMLSLCTSQAVQIYILGTCHLPQGFILFTLPCLIGQETVLFEP